MDLHQSFDTNWLLFAFPAILKTQYAFDPILVIAILVAFSTSAVILSWAFTPGGLAWKNGLNKRGKVPIPGPRSLPFFGSLFSLSYGLPHRTLAHMAARQAATQLMAFSLGPTPAVVTSNPQIAREILTSPHFANRPLKQSLKSLMFSRAIGFAPDGAYWRLLRRVASAHLFGLKHIAAHEAGRQVDCGFMIEAIEKEQFLKGVVVLRKHLQDAALNNIMGTVFGKRYDMSASGNEVDELRDIVKEGFELLGAFNWSDYLPWLSHIYDPFRIDVRCSALVPRVRKFVMKIIEEHRVRQSENLFDGSDFVDVLLSLSSGEELSEDDTIAILWEMIFRGTDTVALLTEWTMAELVLNPNAQAKLRSELDLVLGDKSVNDANVAKLPYLQAIVKETLRVHPPGPLLSWARLSTSDVHLSNGMVVPAGTTAMVNMWAITHDPNVWKDPLAFRPERFLDGTALDDGSINFDVRGADLRLAPFGAGRRSCPGKNLGLATVGLWVAKLVRRFNWVPHESHPVDLTELLKLSCEMKKPLYAAAIIRSERH
ncbi:cytochrome P450 78A7 [Eucalyptus grandis]|uniref:cytochrome P450 78A7 n=1 Tax=Eucalyptus grandis TaxID=71139 RepID=UPI00192EE7A1|nr:cytochrome P450 78A7 [Eucalyptus grandis]